MIDDAVDSNPSSLSLVSCQDKVIGFTPADKKSGARGDESGRQHRQDPASRICLRAPCDTAPMTA
jgi:hypothetical protein